MPVYLDCNATTPTDPRVAAVVLQYMTEEFGNSGSRTHEFGIRAKKAVQRAREQVADALGAQPDEVVFTSGATESNNLAILGLMEWAREAGRLHILSTQIEHKAVLEPLEFLRRNGFTVELLPPISGGWIEPEAVGASLRPDTALVSVMQVNNETGVIQPIQEICEVLRDHDAYFHVDAAQGFGRLSEGISDQRVDLVSVSGHKIFAPKGIGALVARRRGFDRVPLRPLAFGGGQERGLRPGTLPVPLIVGLGLASELAAKEAQQRRQACERYRTDVMSGLAALGPRVNGDPDRVLPHVVNLSFPGVDSEAALVALKDLVAVANGSACTSQNYQTSHVLSAMGLPAERIAGALRLSWSHTTTNADWPAVCSRLRAIQVTSEAT